MLSLKALLSILVAAASIHATYYHYAPDFFLLRRCPPDGKGMRYPFMTANATEAIKRGYDYIVVGGGTAGCAFAATISERYRVLVIERGDSPYGNPDIEDANNFGKPLSDTNNYTSIAQSINTEDGVRIARARVLGGGTALNAAFYSRASKEYIAAAGWQPERVREAYQWVERRNAFRPWKLSQWSATLKDALLDVGVLPYHGYTVEHVEGTKISASTFDPNGRRHTAADLLAAANSKNIVVLLNATVSRILFTGSTPALRATGVELRTMQGEVHQARLDEASASSELILSSGAIGSPQVLMLSGLGPARHLRQMGIPVLADLPQIGQGISDSPRSTVVVQSPFPLSTSSIQVVGILNGSQTYVESSSFLLAPPSSYGGVLFQKLAFPASRGFVRLQTRDPRDNPSVRFNYYQEAADMDRCVQGSRILARLLETDALQRYAMKDGGCSEIRLVGTAIPGSHASDAEMAKFCRDTLNTMWHFHGGCHVGQVVDRHYRLIGASNLRIVDGSTFRDGPGTNPQATTMMLGRYVAQLIMHERCSPSSRF